MLFGTPLFVLAFLPLTLAGFHLLGRWCGGQSALAFLIGASFLFYGFGGFADLPLLAGSILLNFWLGGRVGRERGCLWFVVGVTVNLSALAMFKYAGFFAPILGLPDPHPALPLGVSFFTFQQIMYLAACRHIGTGRPFLAYGACIAFFAHLVAGPLVRPSQVIPQLQRAAGVGFQSEAVAEGVTIFLLGLGKKLVLGDSFSPLANHGFDAAAAGATLTLIEAWYAVLAFSLQIYFDFSGYSDMAIGIARMFNVHFPINFASPYKALTIQDFWRRWHITLSRFLRDFLYIPLGGNRHGEGRRLVNLMVTMLLGGLWHGAAWKFVLWGGLHGAYLILHQGWSLAAPGWLRLPPMVARAITLLAVIVAWVPFRAHDLATAAGMLRGMAGLNGLAMPAPLVALVPMLGHLARSVPVLAALGDARTLALPDATGMLLMGWIIVLFLPHLHEVSPRARRWALLGTGGFTLQALFFSGAAVPFLYFRF